MCIKSIIVPVSGRSDDEAALLTAFAAAKPFAGHVTALYVHPDPRQAMPYFGMPVTPEVMQDIIDTADAMAKAAAEAARTATVAAARKAQVALSDVIEPADHVTCSFRVACGQLNAVLLAESRLSDLLVLGAGLGHQQPDVHDAFIELLLKAQRPVLVAPAAPADGLLAHVAVGWDGGAAAGHALIAALPFLKKADRVTLYHVATEGLGRHVRLEYPKTYLKLHGVAADCRDIAAAKAGAGVALLDAALQDRVSLLVAGGYGHSRWGETLFGGTTVDLTSQDQVAMFLMH